MSAGTSIENATRVGRDMDVAPAGGHGSRAPTGRRRVLERLASLRLTLVIILAITAGVVTAYASDTGTTWPLVGPLLAFGANLGAALVVNPVFRRQTALLVFHLALIGVVLLIAAGRLTYLKGHLELTEGESFAGRLVSQESGPLHRWTLDRAAFTNLGFTIEYAPGLKRGQTVNALAFRDRAGIQRRAQIGDNVPLVLDGYRFYTSFNKGYAPVFLWVPSGGAAPERGSVHLPAYPIHEYRQAREWSPPGSGLTLWTMLQFDGPVLDESAHTSFRKPAVHQVVVRHGGQRSEMVPGERMEFVEGTLVYEGLSTWMGYTVFHDWTLPWLLACTLVAAASLAVHFFRRFRAVPW